jgi:uncharacterized repeat protein (TIGR01451 family)
VKTRSAFALFSLFIVVALVRCSTESTGPPPPEGTADLSVTKSDQMDPVNVGDDIVYTVTVSNQGPDGATEVRATDAVPTGTSFVSVNPSQGSCSESGGTVTCDLGSLASASTASFTLTVTANQAGQVTNTANVSSDVDDPDSSNNAATEMTAVQALQADLSLAKIDLDDPVALGDDIDYAITITNSGPGNATGVRVTDSVPSGTNFVSATPSQGSCDEQNGTVTCDLGSLASGADATVALTVQTTRDGEAINTAAVSANEADPDEDNNADSESTLVQGRPADLEIAKASERDTVGLGEDLVYSIVVRNRGPNEAGSVRMTDTIPDRTTFVSVETTRGDCTEASGIVICDVGPLGFNRLATITLTVEADTLGDVINTARVTGSVQDTAVSNNAATDTTAIRALADLSIDKRDEDDPVDIDDALRYVIKVLNDGPQEAADVMVTDTLPAETVYEDATTTAGSCSERREIVTCDLDTLAAGDSVTITFETTAVGTGTATNRAWVGASVQDPDTENNFDIARTTIRGPQADLTISKLDQADPVNVGQNIVYTIDVLNLGPEEADGVIVTDAIPAGTTFVSATVSPGSCSESGGVVTCDVGRLPSGVGTTITLTLQANQAGQVTNTATVIPPPIVEDPNTNNNSASQTTTVN